MKPQKNEILSYLYGILNNTLLYGGNKIPVYTGKADGDYYIKLSCEQQPDMFEEIVFEHNLTAEVVYTYDSEAASRKAVNNIGDELLEILENYDIWTLPNSHVVMLTNEGGETTVEKIEQKWQAVNTITIKINTE